MPCVMKRPPERCVFNVRTQCAYETEKCILEFLNDDNSIWEDNIKQLKFKLGFSEG